MKFSRLICMTVLGLLVLFAASRPLRADCGRDAVWMCTEEPTLFCWSGPGGAYNCEWTCRGMCVPIDLLLMRAHVPAAEYLIPADLPRRIREVMIVQRR